jgi:hypothetical protein
MQHLYVHSKITEQTKEELLAKITYCSQVLLVLGHTNGCWFVGEFYFRSFCNKDQSNKQRDIEGARLLGSLSPRCVLTFGSLRYVAVRCATVCDLQRSPNWRQQHYPLLAVTPVFPTNISSETLVSATKSTRRYKRQAQRRHLYCCEDIESHLCFNFSSSVHAACPFLLFPSTWSFKQCFMTSATYETPHYTLFSCLLLKELLATGHGHLSPPYWLRVCSIAQWPSSAALTKCWVSTFHCFLLLLNPRQMRWIRSSKAARSVNPRCTQLVLYGFNGDTGRRPWKVRVSKKS